MTGGSTMQGGAVYLPLSVRSIVDRALQHRKGARRSKRDNPRQADKRACLSAHLVSCAPLKLRDDAGPSGTIRADASHAPTKLFIRRVKDFFLKCHNREREEPYEFDGVSCSEDFLRLVAWRPNMSSV